MCANAITIIKIKIERFGNNLLKICTVFEVFNGSEYRLLLYESKKSSSVMRCSVDVT